MESQPKTYYVIKPTTHQRKKVTYGDALALTESQARPLRHGGFITPDKAAAVRIGELIAENQQLRAGQPHVDAAEALNVNTEETAP